MRRRISLILALAAAVVVSACSSVTSPNHNDQPCSGYVSSSGECIPG